MSESPSQDSTEEIRVLRRAADGDEKEWRQLLDQYRGRLKRMVAMRLDKRMQARADASDVVQDAFVEAYHKLPDYLNDPAMPFYLWLRAITGHKLMALHRFHLGTQRRAARREISIYGGAMPETTSACMADFLAANHSRPSEAAIRDELKTRLQTSLEDLDPIDREVLMLRHFEQLTNAETAQVLEIAVSAASKRYIRALERMKGILSSLPGDL